MTAPSATRVEAVGLTTLPRVNLIPSEIAERRTLRHVQAGLAGAGLVALAIVVVLFLVAAGSVSSARRDLAGAQADNATVQGQVNGLQNVGQTYALVDQAHGLLRDAAGGEILWSSYLTDLSLRIPDSVWLTKVTVSAVVVPAGGTATMAAGIAQISFEGTALSHDDVARWLDAIAKERGWTNPYFAKSEEKLIGSRKTYDFTSTVTVTADALSGRYTKPSGS